MNTTSIAPCGVICDICIGFQRDRNRCAGCLSEGNKPRHCTVCGIKACPEKEGNENLLCGECPKFPCGRIKNLDKRYTTKYGESPIENLAAIKKTGLEAFLRTQEEKWTCAKCGRLLCVHRAECPVCGAGNPFFPQAE